VRSTGLIRIFLTFFIENNNFGRHIEFLFDLKNEIKIIFKYFFDVVLGLGFDDVLILRMFMLYV